MLRVLDLFSGIGGFSLGLRRAGGFETIAFCEVDPYCNGVLSKWWPKVPNFDCGIVGLNGLLKRVRTSSQRASRAKTYRSLVQAPDCPEPVLDSSGHSYVPFAWFDRNGRCWKTWQRCLFGDWETFSDTWPRSGMTRNGIAFRRQPLARLTGETASGSSLPTPTAKANMMAPSMQKWAAHRNLIPTPRPCSGLRSSGANRTEIVNALKAWPTPRATDGTHGGRVTARKARNGGNLVEAVSASTFPTPTSRDWRSGKASPATMERNSRPLSEEIGGALNPTWVEWLMGYPLGWTDLRGLETQLFRTSRKCSEAPSAKPRKRVAKAAEAS